MKQEAVMFVYQDVPQLYYSRRLNTQRSEVPIIFGVITALVSCYIAIENTHLSPFIVDLHLPSYYSKLCFSLATLVCQRVLTSLDNTQPRVGFLLQGTMFHHSIAP